jgi:starch phosphorylase
MPPSPFWNGIRTTVSMGKDFATACEKIHQGHDLHHPHPVPAGHDVFPFQLIEKYFHSYWPGLGLDRDAFFQLGIHPEKPEAGFNMTAFALRLSGLPQRREQAAR